MNLDTGCRCIVAKWKRTVSILQMRFVEQVSESRELYAVFNTWYMIKNE
jgi:hypothetical protein